MVTTHFLDAEDVRVIDTDESLVPIINKIKQGIGMRLERAPGAAKVLNATINSAYESSSMIVGLGMAMWSMCNLLRVRCNHNMYKMLCLLVQIVPWKYTVTSRERYVAWSVALLHTMLKPFDRMPCSPDGKDLVYARHVMEFCTRVNWFRKRYDQLRVRVTPEFVSMVGDDELHTWFYTNLVKSFDVLGSVVNDMTFHFMHLTEVLKLEAISPEARCKFKRFETSDKFVMRPRCTKDDTRLVSFIRAIECVIAFSRIKPPLAGWIERFRLRRARLEHLAYVAMCELLNEEARCEAMAMKLKARKAHRRAAREASRKALIQDSGRAYTLHPVWMRLRGGGGEMSMRLEIEFPENTVATNTENEKDVYGLMRHMLERRRLREALLYHLYPQ